MAIYGPKRKDEEEERLKMAEAPEQAQADASAPKTDAKSLSSGITLDMVNASVERITGEKANSAFSAISYTPEFVGPGTIVAQQGSLVTRDPQTGKKVYDFSSLEGKSEQWINANRSAIAHDSDMAEAYDKYAADLSERRTQNRAGMSALAGFNLFDVNGNDIDVNTASPQMIVQGIQGIADKNKQKQAADLFITLTKTPGSRFYGFTTDADLTAYRDSAEMTLTDYNSTVDEYRQSFYAGEGHEQENAEAYRYHYERIQTEQSGYVRRLLTEALEQAYRDTTYAESAPDMHTPEAEQAAEAVDNAEALEEKGGLLDRIESWVGGLFAGDEKTEEEAGEAEPQSVGQSAGEAEREEPQPERTAAEAEREEPEQAEPVAEIAAPTSAQTAQEGGRWYEKAPGWQKGQEPAEAPAEAQTAQPVEAQGTGGRWFENAPGWQEGQETAQNEIGFLEAAGAAFSEEIPQAEQTPLPAAGTVNLADDPVRAAMYANGGEGNLLDAQTQEALNSFIGASPSAQAFLGLDYTDFQELTAQAEGGDPFAVARANAALKEYLSGDISGLVGSTLGGYYTKVQGRSFPAELKDDAIGALMQIGRDAESACASGQFAYDPEKENMYEAYLRQFPEALTTVRGVFRTVDEMNKEARSRAILSANEAQKTEAELLSQSRLAVQSGSCTQEDIERVAAAMPVMSTWEAEKDAAYSGIIRQIREARILSDVQEGGWFNDTAADMMLEMGLGTDMKGVDALICKDMLQEYVQDELLKDERIAKGLGYESLDAYYQKQGGFDMENLYARAAVSMQKFSESVTQDELETVYRGTGAGVKWGEDVAAGAMHGASSAAADALESLWMMGRATQEERSDAVASTRSRYVQEYGFALASYMYEQDWRNYLDTGAVVSEEYKQYVQAYIDSGEDVFQLAGVPDAENIVLRGAVKMDKATQAVARWAQENLTPEQGKSFEVASTTTSNALLQGMAFAINAATGSPFVGTFGSFGLASTYPQEVRKQLAGGRSLAEANKFGMRHALTVAVANMQTSGKLTDKTLRALGVPSAITNGLSATGAVGAEKTMLGMARAFGGGFAKGAAEMAADELVTDEVKERLLWQGVEAATAAELDGAGVMEAIGAGLANVDAVGVVGEVLGEIPESVVYMSPMIFMGGLSDGFTSTRLAAQKLATTGSAEDAKAFVSALNAEIQGPQQKNELNQYIREVQIGQTAAGVLMTDQEIRPTLETAQKTQEQADSHKAEADASMARMENAKKTYYERKEAGDIDAANAALMDFAKARQGLNEHTREAEQKQVETDQLMNAAVTQATSKARVEVTQRTQSQMDAVANERAVRSEAEMRSRESGNIAALDAEDFLAERYPNATEEQRQAVYAEFAQGESGDAKLTKASAEFASRIARKFGVKIQFGDISGAQGAYRRAADTITLDPNATQGDVIRSTMVHELTHRTETSGEYDSLSDALLSLKYGENSAQLDADIRSIMGRYEAYYAQQGRNGAFTEADARRELVADAAAEIIGGNEEMINRLVADRPSVARRILNAIRDFIDKLRGVRDPEMENLRRVETLFEKALKTSGEGQGEQYSLVGRTENGEGIYTSNFNANTPRQVKIDRFVDLWQNIWSKKPIDLEIVGADGNARTVTASFNPDYDPENQRMTDLGKVLHSRNGSSGDRTITLNLADDLHDMASESSYVDSENESGKRASTHDGVKEWHYFSNDFVYRDESGDKPMTLWLDLKEKEDGGWVYQMYAKKRKKGDSSQPREISSARQEESPSDTSIADASADVNTQSTQNQQFSLPSQNLLRQEIAAWRGARQAEAQQEDARRQGERQFVKKTLQSSRAMPSYIRQTLFNDPTSRYYEMDSNDEQIVRAYQTIEQEGRQAAIERILTNREMATKDEIAQANVLMAQAAHDGDMSTLLALSRHYAEDTTEIAQALQAMKIFKRMTPAGAMEAAAAQNEALLAEYIQGHEPMRREVEAKVREIETEIEKKRGGDPIALLGSGGMTLTKENSKWGVPLNERQEALIEKYKLQNVARPGIHYNRATVEQRMLEAILATPDPLEGTNEGLTLVSRLEYMKKGAPVVTNADLEYIGHQLELYTAMSEAEQEDRIGQLALARAYEANANITQATLSEKIDGQRFVNMLLNLTSPMRNVMGNTLQTGVNATSDALAVVLDNIIALGTKTHTKALVTPKELVQGWKAFVQETKDTFRDYFVDKAIVKQGEGRFDVNRRGRVYQGWLAETERNVESFLMSVGDRNFWKMAYTNSMAEQMRVAKKNKRELDFEAAHEQAERDANYATFNEDNLVRDALTQLKNAGAVGKGVDMLMPFTGVPTNIMKRQLEYGPVGLGYTCIRHAKRAATKQTFDQRAFVEELSRGLTGVGLAALGFGLAQIGGIIGGTSEEEESERYYMRTAEGEQYTPFIKVGDEYVSLSTFSPAVSPIIMGAMAYEAWKGDADIVQAFTAAVSSSLDSIIDASYFSSLQEILTGEGTFPEKVGKELLSTLPSQGTPSLVSQIASMMDPYVRDTKDANWVKQSLNKLMARIPGLRETLPIKYDVTGDAVENSKYGWRALLDPFTTTKAEDDEAVSELMALSDRTGETSFLTGYLISSGSYKLSVTKTLAQSTRTGNEAYKLELTAEQKSEVNRRYADLLYNGGGDIEGLRSLIDSPMWKRMDDEERIEEVRDMKSAAKAEVTKWAVKEYGG